MENIEGAVAVVVVVFTAVAAAATIGKDGMVRWSFKRGQGEEDSEILEVPLFPDSIEGVPGEEVQILLSSEDGDCVERTEEDDDDEEVVVEVEEEEAEEDEPW